MEDLRDPKTNEPVFKNVFQREEVYWGNKLNSAPDILFVPNDKFNISSSLTKTIFKYGKTSFHAQKGIFLSYGPDIKAGIEVHGTALYDLAPTILHIFGFPIQSDMDGKVLKNIFRKNSSPAKRKVETKAYPREKDRITGGIRRISFGKKI
jgi:predicted AlkP superfamily phosphohydrolase/phosphomutase